MKIPQVYGSMLIYIQTDSLANLSTLSDGVFNQDMYYLLWKIDRHNKLFAIHFQWWASHERRTLLDCSLLVKRMTDSWHRKLCKTWVLLIYGLCHPKRSRTSAKESLQETIFRQAQLSEDFNDGWHQTSLPFACGSSPLTNGHQIQLKNR